MQETLTWTFLGFRAIRVYGDKGVRFLLGFKVIRAGFQSLGLSRFRVRVGGS